MSHTHPSPTIGSQPGLDTQDNLFDFFLGHVARAVDGHGQPVSEESTWYLTSLLVERANPAADAEQGAETLAELRMQAAQGDRPQAIRAYRSLGDQALVTSGFFRQSLARKLVSRKYYIDMGAAAYDTLAGLLRAAGFTSASGAGEGARGLDAVYSELAQAFEPCSEVLCEVSDAVRESTEGKLSDADILALYEEWMLTGNPRIAARLARMGVMADKDGRVS